MSDLAELLVVVDDGERLVEVVLDSLHNGLGIVIRSAAGLSSLEASLSHDLLWDVVVEDLEDFAHMLLEVSSLVNGSGESIDQVVLNLRVKRLLATYLRWGCDQGIDQNLTGELEWHEVSLCDYSLDLLSDIGAL